MNHISKYHTRDQYLTPWNNMDKFLSSNFGPWLGQDAWQDMPLVNIGETDDSFVVELAIPGISKDNLKINLEDHKLSIEAVHEQKSEEESELKDKRKYFRKEFQYSKFKKVFDLDESIAQDNIEAKYEDGILAIKLVKKQPVVTVNKSIDIK